MSSSERSLIQLGGASSSGCATRGKKEGDVDARHFQSASKTFVLETGRNEINDLYTIKSLAGAIGLETCLDLKVAKWPEFRDLRIEKPNNCENVGSS